VDFSETCWAYWSGRSVQLPGVPGLNRYKGLYLFCPVHKRGPGVPLVLWIVLNAPYQYAVSRALPDSATALFCLHCACNVACARMLLILSQGRATALIFHPATPYVLTLPQSPKPWSCNPMSWPYSSPLTPDPAPISQTCNFFKHGQPWLADGRRTLAIEPLVPVEWNVRNGSEAFGQRCEFDSIVPFSPQRHFLAAKQKPNRAWANWTLNYQSFFCALLIVCLIIIIVCGMCSILQSKQTTSCHAKSSWFDCHWSINISWLTLTFPGSTKCLW